jgi:hypothetical protein
MVWHTANAFEEPLPPPPPPPPSLAATPADAEEGTRLVVDVTTMIARKRRLSRLTVEVRQ